MLSEPSPIDREALRIVVGFDFGPGGERALRHALAVAERHEPAECELHVVYACDPSETLHPQLLELPVELWQAVEKITSTAALAPQLRLATHVRRGSPQWVLQRVADQFQADYIYVGGQLGPPEHHEPRAADTIAPRVIAPDAARRGRLESGPVVGGTIEG